MNHHEMYKMHNVQQEPKSLLRLDVNELFDQYMAQVATTGQGQSDDVSDNFWTETLDDDIDMAFESVIHADTASISIDSESTPTTTYPTEDLHQPKTIQLRRYSISKIGKVKSQKGNKGVTEKYVKYLHCHIQKLDERKSQLEQQGYQQMQTILYLMRQVQDQQNQLCPKTQTQVPVPHQQQPLQQITLLSDTSSVYLEYQSDETAFTHSMSNHESYQTPKRSFIPSIQFVNHDGSEINSWIEKYHESKSRPKRKYCHKYS
jgi:hypothetical protein